MTKKYIYGLIISFVLGITSITLAGGMASDGGGSGLISVPAAAGGAGDVTAGANLGDNLLIRGDGAGKGVQNTGISIDDSDAITGVTLDSDTNVIHADTNYVGARNVSGSTITAGSPVFDSGYNVGQDKTEIELAEADVGASMDAIGLVESEVLNNANIHVISSGVIENLDTTGTPVTETWLVGQDLYVSATAGELTNVKPTGSTEKIQKIASVLRAHATLGRLLVQGAGRSNDIPNDVATSDILIPLGTGTPTVDQLEEYFNNTGSSGYFIGGELTDGGAGTLDVAAGEGFIRTTADDNAQLVSFKWNASAGIAVADNTTQYVFVDDAGTISLNTDEFLEAQDNILIGLVTDESAAIENVFNLGVRLEESIGRAGKFMRRFHGIVRDNRRGGLMFGQSGDANRDVSVTTGHLLWGRTDYTISAFNTSGADVFDSYSAGGQESTGNSLWDNDNYDNSGTLTSLSANRWAALWWYIEPDDEIVMIYGRDQYTSEALAEAEAAPNTSIPNRVADGAVLAARFIFQKSANSATISSAFDTVFAGNGVTDHGNLAGLADDDHTQYILADGTRALAGAWDMASQNLTNVDIDSGTLDGITTLQMPSGDIGATGARITKGWYTDLQVTNNIAGSITGNAATVSTITGLAPDTATTQAAQPNITSVAASSLLTLGTASTTAGGIILKNATNANNVTMQSGVTSTTYTMTLPLAVAGAGQQLTDAAGNGVLSWAAAGAGSGTFTWVEKNGAYTAVTGDGIMVGSDTGAITITGPASASLGDTFAVNDQDGNAGTNNITIARNGLVIMGLSEDLILDINNQSVILVYSADAAKGWRIR